MPLPEVANEAAEKHSDEAAKHGGEHEAFQCDECGEFFSIPREEWGEFMFCEDCSVYCCTCYNCGEEIFDGDSCAGAWPLGEAMFCEGCFQMLPDEDCE